MTCVVGIVKGNIVYIGEDSLGTGYFGETVVRKDPKVFQVGEYLFGCAGSFRMMQLLRFSIEYPLPKKGQDVYEFMCTTFIDLVRKNFKEGGYSKVKDNTEESDGIFLVGFRGRLFCIDHDFQVGESVDNFMATGSGESISLGSLYTTKHIKDSKKRIITALESAERYMSSVRRPFIIMELEA